MKRAALSLLALPVVALVACVGDYAVPTPTDGGAPDGSSQDGTVGTDGQAGDSSSDGGTVLPTLSCAEVDLKASPRRVIENLKVAPPRTFTYMTPAGARLVLHDLGNGAIRSYQYKPDASGTVELGAQPVKEGALVAVAHAADRAVEAVIDDKGTLVVRRLLDAETAWGAEISITSLGDPNQICSPSASLVPVSAANDDWVGVVTWLAGDCKSPTTPKVVSFRTKPGPVAGNFPGFDVPAFALADQAMVVDGTTVDAVVGRLPRANGSAPRLWVAPTSSMNAPASIALKLTDGTSSLSHLGMKSDGVGNVALAFVGSAGASTGIWVGRVAPAALGSTAIDTGLSLVKLASSDLPTDAVRAQWEGNDLVALGPGKSRGATLHWIDVYGNLRGKRAGASPLFDGEPVAALAGVFIAPPAVDGAELTVVFAEEMTSDAAPTFYQLAATRVVCK